MIPTPDKVAVPSPESERNYMTDDTGIIIKQPYIIMFKDDVNRKAVCHLYPHDLDHRGYGLLICDLVRHVAKHFDVHEDAIWDWVERERDKPTTKLEGGQPS